MKPFLDEKGLLTLDKEKEWLVSIGACALDKKKNLSVIIQKPDLYRIACEGLENWFQQRDLKRLGLLGTKS